ncbi:hypothetical protein [Halotia branconii]|uniref:Uncharacterized protein n=1 Tax=Halotia branconii CENA392 TaxID=1539056 RepID=A0AAJ6NPZ7_9CYAN|nr:hypothetical protein [Halotia branconii]WGV24273.1 hypothetical protein QI031_21100 [Halotia branconii CENA392]
MNMWIVTTGNSDIILKHDKNWGNLYSEVRYDLECTEFASPIQKDPYNKEAGYTVPPRILGLVYGNQSDEYKSDLEFPLLDTYYQHFLDKKTKPERIVILLTDQAEIFDEDQRLYEKCPFWQDTCTLTPLLEWYFKYKFDSHPEFLYLTPKTTDRGIDNWNQTLVLVQEKFRTLDCNFLKTVYVSHQAGTPAISSAVQFMSLARFGKQVKFLVSNEYEPREPIFIDSPIYLKGLQLQEAKALLERFDYSGVKRLLKQLWEGEVNSQEQKIKDLLDMAILWNCADFKKFAQAREKLAKERLDEWWWVGYEAAYLGMVRLEQGNTVEALFHSFRAVEGLIRDRNRSSKESLHQLISKLPDWQKNVDFKIFNETTRKERNSLFHNILGLEEIEVFKRWETNNKKAWEARVLNCLNYITGQKFTSLEKATLMYDVHKELKNLISNYELKI